MSTATTTRTNMSTPSHIETSRSPFSRVPAITIEPRNVSTIKSERTKNPRGAVIARIICTDLAGYLAMNSPHPQRGVCCARTESQHSHSPADLATIQYPAGASHFGRRASQRLPHWKSRSSHRACLSGDHFGSLTWTLACGRSGGSNSCTGAGQISWNRKSAIFWFESLFIRGTRLRTIEVVIPEEIQEPSTTIPKQAGGTPRRSELLSRQPVRPRVPQLDPARPQNLPGS